MVGVKPLRDRLVSGTDLVGAVPPHRQEGHLRPDERHVLVLGLEHKKKNYSES